MRSMVFHGLPESCQNKMKTSTWSRYVKVWVCHILSYGYQRVVSEVAV